jgi:putative membrane protein
MKNLISGSDKEKIKKAIDDLERTSTGELLTFITFKSSNYLYFRYVFSSVIALFIMFFYLVFLKNIIFYNLDSNLIAMLLYLLVFTFCFFISEKYFVLQYLIPNKVKKHKCEKQASIEFFKNGMYKTKDNTGILIYISILEKEVIVIGDEGINSKIESKSWDLLINTIIEGIKSKDLASGIVAGLKASNDLVKTHFPLKEEYLNEISNSLIIKS